MADFKAIKAHVTILDVLSRYRIELRKQNGYSHKGKCPLPMHTSESDRESFTANSKINAWVCHSSTCVAARNTKKRDGQNLKKGGDVLEFVQHMEQVPSLRQAGELLESWFGPFGETRDVPAAVSPQMAPVEVDEEAPVNEPLKFELQGIDPCHEYLIGRGFEEEECSYLGAGFFPGRGVMTNRVVFPIHNAEGQLVAYVGRSADPNCAHDERWRFPPGFSKSAEVYNLHRVEGDEAIVTEGFWGVLACIRAGIMNAVSVMGTSISDVQSEALAAMALS